MTASKVTKWAGVFNTVVKHNILGTNNTMDFEHDLSSAQADIGVAFPLKKEQRDALNALYSKRDTVCVLPTGFGKSLIFQLSPFLLGHRDGTEAKITIVISPLNSIMQDQVRRLCEKGVACCTLNMECTDGETFMFKSSGERKNNNGKNSNCQF